MAIRNRPLGWKLLAQKKTVPPMQSGEKVESSPLPLPLAKAIMSPATLKMIISYVLPP